MLPRAPLILFLSLIEFPAHILWRRYPIKLVWRRVPLHIFFVQRDVQNFQIEGGNGYRIGQQIPVSRRRGAKLVGVDNLISLFDT